MTTLLENDVTATWSIETWFGVIAVFLTVNGILITHSLLLRGIRVELKRLTSSIVSIAMVSKQGKSALAKLVGSEHDDEDDEGG